jgi:hypothetical protein
MPVELGVPQPECAKDRFAHTMSWAPAACMSVCVSPTTTRVGAATDVTKMRPAFWSM